MPLHHYLPATYLAEFAINKRILPRKRRIFVGNKQTKEVFASIVSKVAGINNFYKLVDLQKFPDALEELWADYEQILSKSIKLLIGRQVDAKTWIRILVPFVTCMLVRGVDFEGRFRKRMEDIGLGDLIDKSSKDNVNVGRLLDLQGLLAPVAAAKWTVYQIFGFVPIIANDYGYSLFFDPVTNDPGMAIPLTTNHVLTIVPTESRVVAVNRNGKWVPIIRYESLPPGTAERFNLSHASFANKYIFGSSHKVVNENVRRSIGPPPLFEPSLLGFDQKMVEKAFEFTWYRLAVALERNPNDVSDFEIDWDIVGKSWHPIPIPSINYNSSEIPPPLEKKNGMLKVKYYDPKIHNMIWQIEQLELVGNFVGVLNISNDGLSLVDDQKLKYKLLVAKAGALSSLGRFVEAENVFRQAIETDPNNPTAFTNLGYSYIKMGQFGEAMAPLNYAIEIDPKLGMAFLNRGTVFLQMGDYSGAKENFATASELFSEGPYKACAYYNLGGMNLLMGDFFEAIINFTKAIDQIHGFDNDTPFIPKTLSSIFLVEDQSISSNSIDKCDFFIKRARSFVELNLLEEALEDTNCAILLNRQNTKAHDLRRKIILEKSKRDKRLLWFKLWLFDK